MWAVNDAAKVRLLLDRGADVNLASENGRTALLLAAMADTSADMVRLLLSRGANARAVDTGGMTTLLGASIGNDTDSIRHLLDAGVNPNAADTIGTTPLSVAAVRENLDAVRLLLSRGANVNAVSGPPSGKVKNGITALGYFTPLLQSAAYGPYGGGHGPYGGAYGQYPAVPPGWYPDPQGPGLRWWDGTRWTEHVADRPGP